MRVLAVAVCLLFLTSASAATVRSSPVQKVIELLGELKTKVESDLAAEKASFAEYATYCDDEVADKNYAIKTAKRQISDLAAAKEDSEATILGTTSAITELGGVISDKTSELDKATKARKAAHADFLAGEAELVQTVDELGRGISVLKEGSFLQGKASREYWQKATGILNTIVDAMRVGTTSHAKLESFLQAAKKRADDDDDDDDLKMPTVADLQKPLAFIQQPNPAPPAIESQSGAIIETMEEMQDKSTKNLRALRKAEMQENMDFEMLRGGLESEISHTQEKLANTKEEKAAAEQALGDATEKQLDTEKSKAADEEFVATTKSECQAKARAWEERERSGNGEIAAIAKATEILSAGVTAFAQVGSRTRVVAAARSANVRDRVVEMIRSLAKQQSSFALAQLATSVASDPFVKIRGLIEEMIEKLQKEAAEEATQKAFCDEELGKSNKAKEEKTGDQSKFKARMDTAEATVAKLVQGIKTLQREISEIDQGQAEATKLRQEENAEYKKASADYKGSAEAVAQAIEVLRQYYEGASFVQLRSSTRRVAAKDLASEASEDSSDSAHVIISVLDMAQEDFTQLLAECEAEEGEAKKAFEKLTQENKLSKMTKEMEVKGKESEVKSVKVALEHGTEDYDSVTKELEAVNRYLAKLEPQCESKGQSPEEKKAAREAEIEGLKEALTILEGPAAFVQTGRYLRSRRVA